MGLPRHNGQGSPFAFPPPTDNPKGKHLNSPCCLQQAWQLKLFPLQITVPADVLLVDVDVGYSALTVNLLESGLEIGSIIYLTITLLTIIIENGRIKC